MEILVLAGAAISLVGLAGIVWSLLAVMRARRSIKDDAALRARIREILPVNLGALLFSVLGLMAIVIGLILG